MDRWETHALVRRWVLGQYCAGVIARAFPNCVYHTWKQDKADHTMKAPERRCISGAPDPIYVYVPCKELIEYGEMFASHA